MERLGQRWETLESEQLKSAAELSLHSLARVAAADGPVWNMVRGGPRIEDDRLQVEVAGLTLENPLLVGAGWDKKGRAVDGLYALGFAGTEVGSVLPFPQSGNARPRMWYEDGAGYNRMGFNSIGMERVEDNLVKQRRSGIVGISLGKNKLLPDAQAPWAHAAVAERLHDYADYLVINVASPNTPGLRNLLKREPLTDIVQAVQDVLRTKGDKPLFIKTTVDLTLDDLDTVLAVSLEENVAGVIDTNTSVDPEIKRQYGWENLHGNPMGGVSGDIEAYRQKAAARMKHITRETRGTGLQRIGVGAINSAESAWERMEDGAQALQVVTAIRQHKSKVATRINGGLLELADKRGVRNLSDIVGTAA